MRFVMSSLPDSLCRSCQSFKSLWPQYSSVVHDPKIDGHLSSLCFLFIYRTYNGKYHGSLWYFEILCTFPLDSRFDLSVCLVIRVLLHALNTFEITSYIQTIYLISHGKAVPWQCTCICQALKRLLEFSGTFFFTTSADHIADQVTLPKKSKF